MRKRIVPLLLCLVMVLSVLFVLPTNADAATAQETGKAIAENAKNQDGTFPETLPEGQTTYKAPCYACGGAEKEWMPMENNWAPKTDFADGDHYYLPNDVTIKAQFQFGSKKTLCIHTNGHTLTATARVTLLNANSTFNVMGAGEVKANTYNGNRGVLYSNGASTMNIYGTTVENTSPTAHANGNACVTLYNTSAVANFWSCTLIGSSVSPSIITNGAVNLYNCTVTGPAAQVGDYADQDDSKAALNLYDSSVSGVNVLDGTVAASGAAKITGTGLALAEGATIDPSGLTTGASIAIANDGVFTGAGMSGYAKYFTPVNEGKMILSNAEGALCCVPEGAVLVGADGSVTAADDIIAQWNTGNYSYIKLYGDAALAELGGAEVSVDINGFDLTVGGTGTLNAFDSANDTYDADACGTITNNGTVEITEDVDAPNGNRYIAVTNGTTTMHRLDARINAVSLRPGAAGLYYKAKYQCDTVLSALVDKYGVLLSVNNMPGKDFLEETDDVNAYTIAKDAFKSGAIATSGSVFGILKSERDAAVNAQYAEIEIYANAYVTLKNTGLIVVGDTQNADKTTADANFTGNAWSLREVMDTLDDTYYSYSATAQNQLDDFYWEWDEDGMHDWKFVNIGDGVDNSDLVFDEGTTNAFCPVCKEKVTWTELTASDTHQNLNGHYYLAEDQTFTNDGDAFFFNKTKLTTLCVHLNGHNLTATKTRVVHGSSGRTNIMGNGIVSGYHKTADYGSAVMVNNTVESQSVHLYGGTYKKTADSKADVATLCVSNAGGSLVVHKGAVVESSNGPAIIVRTPGANATKQELSLYGCTVNGDVKLMGGAPDVSKVTATVELLDCTVNGNVDIALYNDVKLTGAPVIQSVTHHEDVRLDPTALLKGASVGLAEDGVFSVQVENAANYAGYFHGADAADMITVRDGALHCGPDYTGDLQFAEGTTNAMCPSCSEVVTWIPVDGSVVITNSAANHYYLTKDITFTAANGELSFFSPGHGSYHVCFHLNGHDFTGTNTRFVFGGTSVVNIMGSGTVSCARADKNAYGSTIQTNTSNITGTINLYGGTWTQEESGTYTASDYVISMSNNGGGINVYEGATVVANSNGKAIYLGTCNLRDTIAGIYGTVKGDVYAAGANQNPPADSSGNPREVRDSYITVDNGTIEGTLDIDGINTVTVSHAAKIELLDIEATSLVTMSNMKPGAEITVLNPGVFTEPSDDAQAYVGYFKPANANDIIRVEENALRYKINYAADLNPDADGMAYCPVCDETVQWIAVSSGESHVVAANAGEHYYLTDDILFETAYDSENGPVAFFSGGTVKGSVCFHLNGHAITATQTHGIWGGYGVLNVMGDGVVTGYARAARNGGAVQINNSVAGNCVNLYSGTYRNAANSKADSGVLAIQNVGGKFCIYEDADIATTDSTAIYLGNSTYRDTNLEIYDATIQGGISTTAPSKTKSEENNTVIILDEATVKGEISIALGNEATVIGRTKIDKLTLAAGQLVTFEDMKEGSDITVSAEGVFTPYMELADEWLPYITCADEGDWIIVRDKTFLQEVKPDLAEAAAAGDDDKTALDTTYQGKTVKYGEMHDHTNATERADGNESLAAWKAEMDRLGMDFATIVDHGQSQHMYHTDWDPTYFVGGSEPGTTITDSKADPNKPHYNMVFSDPAKLEALVKLWEQTSDKTEKSKFVIWESEAENSKFTEGLGGFLFSYPSYTTAEFGQLMKDVYEYGGLLVQVHPKYDDYIYSDDPLDYYFADYSGFEITTGSGGNMMYKDNNEAYETWVDLLELGKKIWATSGSDKHRHANITALTTMYTEADHADTYIEYMRTGNFAPGWVGIRMNVNGTAMGGETDFTDQRLQFSVGDIYNKGVADKYNTPLPYVEGHEYIVRLYDDSGLLMETAIDPTQMNYFAIDCDPTAMFYRVVVWDATDNERIGVGNPIWNTAFEKE